MTLLDILSKNREIVIKAYENSHKGITLKEYMNIVLWYFEKAHKGIAKKMIAECESESDSMARETARHYIERASVIATRKSNERYNAKIDKYFEEIER